jgi:hypothetical protein
MPHEMQSELRGSPRPAARAAGSNLVGRGIANPMSERTRGFELPRKKWNEIPTPRAIFPCNLISNFTPYQRSSSMLWPMPLRLVETASLPLPEAKCSLLRQRRISLHEFFLLRRWPHTISSSCSYRYCTGITSSNVLSICCQSVCGIAKT